VLGGGILQLVFILWAAKREGLDLRIGWPRWTPEIKKFFVAFGAVTFGAAGVMLTPLIDTVLASFLETGSRTALYYANRIDSLPMGVLGVALGTVLLPEMSAKLAIGDTKGSNAAQNRAAALSLLLILPFSAVFIAIPDTIMRAIFAHGAFNPESAALAAVALRAYGIGLPAFAMVRIVSSTFYARHDTMTPARITVFAIVANIAMKVVLVWGLSFGIGGIAIGTSFGAWLNVGALVMMGRRRALLAIDTAFWRALPPILLAAALAAAGALFGREIGPRLFANPGTLQDVASLALAGVLGIGFYLTAAFAFRNRLPIGRFAQKKVRPG
jgi:putative peptidoglycan lipid II flippase